MRALAACFAVGIALAPIACGDDSRPPRPFAPDSVFNAEVPRDAPLRPDSQALVGDLVRQVREFGPWINTTRWSVPVYTVPADQPTVRMKVDIPGRDNAWNHDMFTNLADAQELQRDFDAVPIPANAVSGAGTDFSLLIWQPSTDTMWEMWGARHVPQQPLPWSDPTPGWHVLWGAKIENASKHDGRIAAPFGGSASGLALLGGLMRLHEVERGRIDHAISLAIPQPKAAEHVYPATRTDGKYTGPNAIPEGTRFRLDPALDIASLNLPKVTRTIAEAAQRHGLILRDTAGAVVLYGEDPTPSGSDAWAKALGGMSPGDALRKFPWDRLQAVSPEAKLDATSPFDGEIADVSPSAPPATPPAAPAVTPPAVADVPPLHIARSKAQRSQRAVAKRLRAKRAASRRKRAARTARARAKSDRSRASARRV